MQRLSKTRLLTLGLVVILMAFAVSAMAAPGAWTPGITPQHHPAAGVRRAPGQAPAFHLTNESPALKQLKQEMQTAGIKPWQLPKVPFKGPAYKMLVNAAVKAGVPVSKAIVDNPKSLCNVYAGWYAGPSMASNTNGTAVIYGGGMNFYFASASDPSHPLVMPAGDMLMRVYFRGNTAILMGLFFTYAFDVTNPTQPVLLGYDLAGMAFGYTGFGMTADGQYIVGIVGSDDLVVWDSGFNYVYDNSLEGISGLSFSYTPVLADMVIPDTPGSVVLVTDYDNDYIHFIDLSNLACAGPQYLGYIDDGMYGWGDCAQIMYQAPFLYVSYEPWWNYNPLIGGFCPDNGYYLDVFKVPDVSDPANFISVKYVQANNSGNDIVAMRPAGNGNIALGLYNGQVATWDAQLNTLLEFGNMGKYNASGICNSTPPKWDYFTLDMGYSPNGGVTADFAGGARFFSAPSPLAETGHYLTGDYAYNPIAVGNTIYTPEFANGLAIIDNNDPTNPQTLGWLATTSGLPYIGLVGVDGTTAYVAASAYYNNNTGVYTYDATNTKVFAVDVSDPTAPAYLSSASTAFDITAAPGYGARIESLKASGGICWIGTDTSVVGVDFSNPAAPSVVASFTLQGSSTGAFAMTTFTMPAFPQSTMLGVAAGPNIEIYDITSPVQYAGCPNPYFFIGFIAVPNSGNTTALFASGAYLIYNDITNNDSVGSIALTANIGSACATGEVTMATVGTPLVTSAIPSPNFLAYAGTVGGHVVAAAADNTFNGGIVTFDITDPTALAFLNTPPQVVYPMWWGWGISGLFYSNGALYAAGGYSGLSNFILEPGFTPPTVSNVTASPAISGYLTGTVTLSAKVTAADSAVTMVEFDFAGGTVAQVVTNIAAGATQTVTYSWDTSTWLGWCSGTVSATASDAGCNEGTASSSPTTYYINSAPTVTLSNWSQPIPSGGVCVTPGAWVICGGTLTFTATATDGPCNSPSGISQMSLYVDGVFVTYINNTNPWNITLDTTTLTDGPHTVTVTATDAQGLTASVTSPGFTVHNHGPKTTVVAPSAGDVVGGTTIRTAATATSLGSGLPIDKVVFYLDQGTSQQITLGTATTPDANGEFAINWDSTPAGTNTTYGDHTIVAVGYDGGASVCPASDLSPIVSFNLVPYTPMTVTATATPTSGAVPLSVAFTSSVTGGTPPFSYAWDFGDSSTGTGASASHTYTAANTYTWTLTVTDSTNHTATQTGSVAATYTPMTVTITATPTSGIVPLSVNFSTNVTGGAAPFTYAWDFGDSSTTGSGASVSHTYTAIGTYNVVVTVTDQTSATATANVTVTVKPVPPTITSSKKQHSPFRIVLFGTNFQSGITATINGTSVTTSYKNSGKLKLKHVKSLCPKGTAVTIVLTNPDGGVSAPFQFTR